jgi:hypothetical protein
MRWNQHELEEFFRAKFDAGDPMRELCFQSRGFYYRVQVIESESFVHISADPDEQNYYRPIIELDLQCDQISFIPGANDADEHTLVFRPSANSGGKKPVAITRHANGFSIAAAI